MDKLLSIIWALWMVLGALIYFIDRPFCKTKAQEIFVFIHCGPIVWVVIPLVIFYKYVWRKLGE